MKKNLKPMIISALTAVAMGTIGVGTTFALFTDKAETTINVESGVVDIRNSIEIKDAKSLNVDDATEVSESKKSASYVNGGSASVNDADGLVTIEKWTPGDQITLKTIPNNLSNVKTLMRLRVVITGELAPALVLKGKVNDSETVNFSTYEFAGKGQKTLVSNWNPINPEVNPDGYYINIEFPNTDNEIRDKDDTVGDNKYQEKVAQIKIYYEAVQGNAHINDLLDKANSILATKEVSSGSMNKTMFDALDDVDDKLTTFNSAAFTNGYVWSQETDQFYYESSIPAAEKYKYFKMYQSMPTSYDFSIYAYNWESVSNPIVLDGVGFDAGTVEGITQINYSNSGSRKEIVLRSNSYLTNIEVNAPLDVVNHYGLAGTLNIIAAANSSYHEYGKVVYADISKGRMAIEEGALVNNLHISSIKQGEVTTNKFDSIIVAIDENATKPTFSRDAVEIAENGTLVVAIQKGTEDVTEHTDLDYVWLTKQGIYEQIKVSESKEEISENALWADELENDKQTTQEAAFEIANNIDRNDSNKVEAEVEVDNVSYVVTLNEDRDLVVKDTNEDVVEDDEVKTAAIDEAILNTGVPSSSPSSLDEEIEEAISADAVANNYVVRIGENYYNTFEDAYSNVKNGDTIRVLADCYASYHGPNAAYDFSGKNVNINVEKGATLMCGDVTNGKFEIGQNSAAGTLTLEGQGRITFESNNNWGLITSYGSGNSIKAVIKDITIEASTAGGKIMTSGNLTIESGYYKNISMQSGTTIEGGFFTNDVNNYLVEGKMLVSSTNPEYPYVVADLDAAHASYSVLHNSEYTYYKTLTSASGHAENGDTLKFIGDETSIVLDQSNNRFHGTNGVTYDLNGHTIISGTEFQALKLFYLNDGDSVTIKNGTIDVPAGKFCDEHNFTIISQNASYSDAILDDVASRSTGIYVKDSENYFTMQDSVPQEYIAKIERGNKSFYYTRADHGVADALSVVRNGDIVYVNAYEEDAKGTLYTLGDKITVIRSSTEIKYPTIEYGSGDIDEKVVSETERTYEAIPGSICEANGVKYAELSQAIDVIASSGGEIDLLKDIEFTPDKQIPISSWTAATTYTFDLNGHTITHPGGINALFKVTGANGGIYVFKDSVGSGGMKATESNFWSGLISIGNVKGKSATVKFESGIYDNLSGIIVHRLNVTLTTEVNGGTFSKNPQGGGFSTDAPKEVKGTYVQNTDTGYWYQSL